MNNMRKNYPARGAFFIYCTDSDYLKPWIELLHTPQNGPAPALQRAQIAASQLRKQMNIAVFMLIFASFHNVIHSLTPRLLMSRRHLKNDKHPAGIAYALYTSL